MKRTILTIALALLCGCSFGQQSPENLIKEGNKVYVTGRDKADTKRLKQKLQDFGYWVVVDKKSEADFIANIVGHHAFIGVYKARVEFVDPATGKTFYRSKNVNTWTRFTFHAKKAAVKKLMRKRIKGHLHIERSNNYPV